METISGGLIEEVDKVASMVPREAEDLDLVIKEHLTYTQASC
jgi:hypothetical protein